MPRAFLALIFLGGLATSLGCTDLDSACPGWKNSGYCERSPDWMKENCPKSCGICGGNSCSDKESGCTGWKDSGYCERSPEWMKENCEKTCGHCEASSCSDKESNCPGWKNSGYCERSPDWMKKDCEKTCGHCEGTEATSKGCPVEAMEVTDDNKYGCIGGIKAYPTDSEECFPNSYFYKKLCYTAQGLKIISSDQVEDGALERTAFIISHVMDNVDEDVAKEMNRHKFRHAVMAAYPLEKTTDLPEHSDLGISFDERARGLGATQYIPLGSSAVENAMCHKDDRYLGEDITIHEFAHSLHLLGLSKVFTGFEKELEGLYEASKSKQLWGASHYANKNSHEYFAEGVQSYFNANMRDRAAPTDRKQLEEKDPALFLFIDNFLGFNEWEWSCPQEAGL